MIADRIGGTGSKQSSRSSSRRVPRFAPTSPPAGMSTAAARDLHPTHLHRFTAQPGRALLGRIGAQQFVHLQLVQTSKSRRPGAMTSAQYVRIAALAACAAPTVSGDPSTPSARPHHRPTVPPNCPAHRRIPAPSRAPPRTSPARRSGTTIFQEMRARRSTGPVLGSVPIPPNTPKSSPNTQRRTTTARLPHQSQRAAGRRIHPALSMARTAETATFQAMGRTVAD